MCQPTSLGFGPGLLAPYKAETLLAPPIGLQNLNNFYVMLCHRVRIALFRASVMFTGKLLRCNAYIVLEKPQSVLNAGSVLNRATAIAAQILSTEQQYGERL